jgi:hypothetical protein
MEWKKELSILSLSHKVKSRGTMLGRSPRSWPNGQFGPLIRVLIGGAQPNYDLALGSSGEAQSSVRRNSVQVASRFEVVCTLTGHGLCLDRTRSVSSGSHRYFNSVERTRSSLGLDAVIGLTRVREGKGSNRTRLGKRPDTSTVRPVQFQ